MSEKGKCVKEKTITVRRQSSEELGNSLKKRGRVRKHDLEEEIWERSWVLVGGGSEGE